MALALSHVHEQRGQPSIFWGLAQFVGLWQIKEPGAAREQLRVRGVRGEDAVCEREGLPLRLALGVHPHLTRLFHHEVRVSRRDDVAYWV